MAINFPVSIDELTNPSAAGGDTLLSVPHDAQHGTANDILEALEAKVGIDGSAVATSHDYLLAGLETDKANIDQTMYIGTTALALNRGSAALTLAGITLTTPNLGTPSAGTLTNCTFPTLNQNTTGTAANLSGTPDLGIGTLGCGDITSTGQITAANQSGCNIGRGTSAQVIQHNKLITVYFNAENWDTQSEFDTSSVLGTADATEANKLHDADGGFSAGDVGKTVWNTTDNTYTTVSAYVDSGELTLTDDIMADTETYQLYFSRFTAKTAGKYLVTSRLTFTDIGANNEYQIDCFKNGSQVLWNRKFFANGTGYQSIDVNGIVDLSIDDYIEIKIKQESGSVDSIYQSTSGSFLMIQKLS